MPFGIEAARAYGRVFSAVVAAGSRPRRRCADLLIAAHGLAEGLPVVTRNADDFVGLEDFVSVVDVGSVSRPGP